MVGDVLFGDGVGLKGALLHLFSELSGGVGDFGAGAVAEGDDEGVAGVVLGFIHGFLDAFANGQRKAFELAHDAEANMVFVKLFFVGVERFDEQLHESVDFVGGAFPVFGAEGVYGDDFDVERSGGAEYRSDGLSAFAVAFDA